MFNNYDPMKFIKEMHGIKKNIEEQSVQIDETSEESSEGNIEQNEPVTEEQDYINKHTETEKPKKKSKHRIFKFLIVALIIVCGLIFLAYREICAMPFERNDYIGDTSVSVRATYNTKYHVAKIDLTIDEVIEKWQVTLSNGNVSEIKLLCETGDETVKKDFVFKNIPLVEGETIKTSTSFDNMRLNDFLLIKELLSGNVQMISSKIISLDSAEREKLKQYYESGAWFWGLMWANSVMGGY